MKRKNILLALHLEGCTASPPFSWVVHSQPRAQDEKGAKNGRSARCYLRSFGSFLVVLYNFESLRLVLAGFGSFWVIP